jgi:hypothetical protein
VVHKVGGLRLTAAEFLVVALKHDLRKRHGLCTVLNAGRQLVSVVVASVNVHVDFVLVERCRLPRHNRKGGQDFNGSVAAVAGESRNVVQDTEKTNKEVAMKLRGGKLGLGNRRDSVNHQPPSQDVKSLTLKGAQIVPAEQGVGCQAKTTHVGLSQHFLYG